MKYSLLAILIALLLLSSGCYTTGLSPRETGATTYNELVYGLYSQQEKDVAPVAIKLPVRIGVAQIGETSPNSALVNALRQHLDLFAEVIELPLPGDYKSGYYQNNKKNEDDTFKSRAETLRKLGKQLGATHILMVGGHVDSTTSSSPSEILDIAILPAFLLPSKKIEIEAKASAAFLEANSGQVLFLLNTTVQDHGYAPTQYASEKREKLSLQQRDVLSRKIVEALTAKLKQPANN